MISVTLKTVEMTAEKSALPSQETLKYIKIFHNITVTNQLNVVLSEHNNYQNIKNNFVHLFNY